MKIVKLAVYVLLGATALIFLFLAETEIQRMRRRVLRLLNIGRNGTGRNFWG